MTADDALALLLVAGLAGCDSSQPSGYRPSRRTGTQTLVYVVQPHASAALDAAFQRAANTWSWNAHLEVRMVRTCPSARTCIHVQLGDAEGNLAYFQILDGSGLAAHQWHTARIVVQWPFPAGQNARGVGRFGVLSAGARSSLQSQASGSARRSAEPCGGRSAVDASGSVDRACRVVRTTSWRCSTGIGGDAGSVAG